MVELSVLVKQKAIWCSNCNSATIAFQEWFDNPQTAKYHYCWRCSECSKRFSDE